MRRNQCFQENGLWASQLTGKILNYRSQPTGARLREDAAACVRQGEQSQAVRSAECARVSVGGHSVGVKVVLCLKSGGTVTGRNRGSQGKNTI